MTKSRVILSSLALSILLSPAVPLARSAAAQPVPPPPPDLHIRIAPMAPPHVRHEVIQYDARPSKRHVWVKGFWHHDGSEWRWNEGRWLEPPSRRARWIAPQYKRIHGGWRYVPGHWSTEVVIS